MSTDFIHNETTTETTADITTISETLTQQQQTNKQRGTECYFNHERVKHGQQQNRL